MTPLGRVFFYFYMFGLIPVASIIVGWLGIFLIRKGKRIDKKYLTVIGWSLAVSTGISLLTFIGLDGYALLSKDKWDELWFIICPITVGLVFLGVLALFWFIVAMTVLHQKMINKPDCQ